MKGSTRFFPQTSSGSKIEICNVEAELSDSRLKPTLSRKVTVFCSQAITNVFLISPEFLFSNLMSILNTEAAIYKSSHKKNSPPNFLS